MKRTTYEHFLPNSLETFDFEVDLLKAPKTLKDIFNQTTQQEIFPLQERHAIKDLEKTKKNLLFNDHTVDIFLFVVAVILLLVTIVPLFIICKTYQVKIIGNLSHFTVNKGDGHSN